MEQMKLKTPDIRKTECVTILTLQQKLKLMTEITFGVIGGNLLSLTLAIFVYTLLAPSYGESLKAMAAFAAIVTATLPILAVNYRCRIVPKYGMAAFYSIVCASASVFFFGPQRNTERQNCFTEQALHSAYIWLPPISAYAGNSV